MPIIHTKKKARKMRKVNRLSCFLTLFMLITGNGYAPERLELQQANVVAPWALEKSLEEDVTIGPTFVESIEDCVDTAKSYLLPDGYVYEYVHTPIYSTVNQLPLSTNADGSIFNGCGYQDNVRIRSVLELEYFDNSFVTGFIPVTENDVIYFNSDCFDPEYEYAHILHTVFYNEAKESISSAGLQWALNTAFDIVERHPDGYISAVKVKALPFADELSYIRFTLVGSGKGQGIFLNEPLEAIAYEPAWVKSEKYIPASWGEEISNVLKKVDTIPVTKESRMTKFVLASDIHLNPNDTRSYTENMGKVSAAVMDAYDVPFFVSAGDNTTQSAGYKTSDFAINMQQVLEQLNPIPQKRILSTVGNHDGATGFAYDRMGDLVYYRFQLTNQQRSAVFFDWQRETNKDKKFNSDGTYYYLDDPYTKTRYIMLNSFWSSWRGNEFGFVDRLEDSFFHSPRFGARQLTWFAEEALDMPSGYDAVIITHYAPSALDFEIFKGIVNAYSTKTSYQVNNEDLQYNNISVNYEMVDNEIIAVFQGHIHTDGRSNVLGNVPSITISTTGAYWDVRDQDAEERVRDTATEFAMDVVTIDRDNRIIYCARLGAGKHRRIKY